MMVRKRRNRKRLIVLGILALLFIVQGCGTNGKNEPPPLPELASPGNNAVINNNMPTFDWSDSEGALEYDLQVDNYSDFSSPVIDKTISGSDYTPGTELADGEYFWRVRARDGDSNSSAWTTSWRVVINGVPVLSVIPYFLNFDPNDISKSLSIANIGEGSLSWAISIADDWLNVSPVSGTTTTETDTVIVTVDRTGLSPDITYQGLFSIESNEGNQNISVTVVGLITDLPVLSVAPAPLDFDPNDTSKPLSINNTGEGTLSWSISMETVEGDWLNISPESGSTTTETDTITVSVDRTSLGIGEYQGIINIESNGGDQNIPVTLLVHIRPLHNK